jgi:uncharacterized protein YggE
VGSITVSGSSAIRVQPNRVVVVLGIETFAQTPSGSQTQNARLGKKVLEAIRQQGIAERDIATAHFTLQPEYEDGYRHRQIVGYWTRNTVAVTLRDVTKLERVLVEALEAGATAIDDVQFSVTNLRELRDRARDLAVQAALEKATALSSAAGASLGQVTSISEHGNWYGYFGPWSTRAQWTNYQNVVQELGDEGGSMLEDGSLALGQIVVRAEVSLSAELAPGS